MTKKDILNITKNLSLLYVEDDKSMQTTSVELFENFFQNITIASDGLEALSLYKNRKIDVIITDISMPHMDGIELIKQIRNIDPTIPIVVYSALNDPTLMSACVSLNVDAYLLKPMKSKNFMDVLEKMTLKVIFNDDSSNLDIIKKIESRFDTDELTGVKSYALLSDIIDNLTP